jgi:hypothetical protein
MIVGAAEGLAKSREQHRRMLVGVERDHSVLTLLKQLTPREDLALLSTWNAKAVDLLSDAGIHVIVVDAPPEIQQISREHNLDVCSR